MENQSQFNWDTDKMKDMETVEKFHNECKVQIEKRENDLADRDINKKWKNIKEAILQAAKVQLGTKQKAKKNTWYDNECKKIIDEKNTLRRKLLNKHRKEDVVKYKEIRKKAKRVCLQKKKEAIRRSLVEIEELKHNRDIRKFYKAIQKRTNSNNIKIMAYRTEEGSLTEDEEQIKKIWKEHFKKLLNDEIVNTNADTIRELPIMENDKQEEEPSIEEVEQEIKSLKNNKSPGEDGIIAEFFKKGCPTLMVEMYKLIEEIWKQEHMPEEWKVGVILPIHKKGDKTICNNYRGITLLNTAYKIFSKILNNRLTKHTEKILGEYQCGFRPYRSTTDQIFTVRQVMEKFYEVDKELHFLFIDYKQAFDSIKREGLFQVMKELGIPNKLIQLTKMTLEDTRAKVKIGYKTTDSFNINKGVRQGDGLSANLFNLALHSVVKNISNCGNIVQHGIQICAFADDIVLVARSKEKLIKAFSELNESASEIGLIINQDKTKYMLMKRNSVNNLQKYEKLNDWEFEKVENFHYLGYCVNNNTQNSVAIRERIQAGNRAYGAYYSLMKSKIIAKKTKWFIYKTVIRPVVTYSAETWTLTQKEKSDLLIFERKIMRRIYGMKKTNEGWRIRTNHEIDEIISGENIVRFIKALRLSWLGHIHRMKTNRIPRQIYNNNLIGKRRRGRPKIRWSDQVAEDLKAMKIEVWRSKAKVKGVWKKIVGEAKVHEGL